MKKFFIVIVVLLGIAFLYGVYTVVSKKQTKVSTETEIVGTFPKSDMLQMSSSTVATSDAVPTEKIKKQLTNEKMHALVASSTHLGEGEYLLESNDLFEITFLPYADYFAVVLKVIPLEPAQQASETYLLKKFEVTSKELCELPIDVFAPYFSDPNWSQDLGFSECPGPRTPTNLQ